MLHFPKLNTGIQSIDSQWERLCRKVQAYIEHHPVTITSGLGINRGYFLAMEDNREVTRTDASDSSYVTCVGASSEAGGAEEQIVMTTSNVELVRMESDLTPSAGEAIYLSASTAGAGTNVVPKNPNYIARVGIILDASMYDSTENPYVDAVIFRCCAPQEIVL